MDERVHGSAAGIQLPAGRTPWMMCPMKQVLPSVNLSAWIKRTSFLVEHENDPRVENPQPSQRKRQKIMGEDPQSLENHGFPQISQLVLHSTKTPLSSRKAVFFSALLQLWGTSPFPGHRGDPNRDPDGSKNRPGGGVSASGSSCFWERFWGIYNAAVRTLSMALAASFWAAVVTWA